MRGGNAKEGRFPADGEGGEERAVFDKILSAALDGKGRVERQRPKTLFCKIVRRSGDGMVRGNALVEPCTQGFPDSFS